MSEKPRQADTSYGEGVLRSAFNFGTPITKDRMEIMGHRLGTYEALYNRGLMSRPALSHSPATRSPTPAEPTPPPRKGMPHERIRPDAHAYG